VDESALEVDKDKSFNSKFLENMLQKVKGDT